MENASPPGVVPKIKRASRSRVDRLAAPYLDDLRSRIQRLEEELGSSRQILEATADRTHWLQAMVQQQVERPLPKQAVLDGLLPSFYPLLHELRSVELSRMPPGASTLLGAGCGGRWYFDWFEEWYGPVERHIGVEAYLPKPDDLPPYVEWVTDDVMAMPHVDDAVVDLVFSGQNIEHLWPDQVTGFLLESHRVLRPGGWLVLDSPNREITSALAWSHDQHIVEFTVPEAVELVELAGFGELDVRGIWLSRDAGKVLPLFPLDPAAPSSPAGVLRRIALAEQRPEDSFVWWIEARKVGKPEPEQLRNRVQEIHRHAWPERTRRLVAHRPVVLEGGERWVPAAAGEPGAVFGGPFLPLRPGRYVARFQVRVPVAAPDAMVVARCEVTRDINAQVLLAGADVTGTGQFNIEVPFDLEEVTFGIQFRVISTGAADVAARLLVDLDEPLP